MSQASLLPLTLQARSGYRRPVMVALMATMALVTLGVMLGPLWVPDAAAQLNPVTRYQAPSVAYWMGTDALGRDLTWRVLDGLSTSARIGLTAAALSTWVALVLGVASALHPRLDQWIGAVTELVLGLPHLVLLLLITFALGGGLPAVVTAIALTHWPRLSRVIRAETQAVAQSDFVLVSRRLGRSRLWVAQRHLVPHLLPQLIAGFVLVFPHAILHEAALSFLGMGVDPHVPAIGILLSESLGALSAGHWWLAVFPGLGLVALAVLFEVTGESLRRVFSLEEVQS